MEGVRLYFRVDLFFNCFFLFKISLYFLNLKVGGRGEYFIYVV